MAFNVNGTGMTKINVNGVAMTDVAVNGVIVFGGIPSTMIVYANGGSANSEYVTGVMAKQTVQSFSWSGKQTKTVNIPFSLTDKAKQTYNTCTVVVGYAIGGDYGFAHVKYNGADLIYANGSGTKTYTISTSSAFGSLSVDAEGTVDYTGKWAEVWIESITLSGKK